MLKTYVLQDLDVVSMAVTYDKRFHELSAYWTQQLEADPNVAVCTFPILLSCGQASISHRLSIQVQWSDIASIISPCKCSSCKEFYEYDAHTAIRQSSYMRLVVLSQGFQHCVKHGISRDSYIFRQVRRRLSSDEPEGRPILMVCLKSIEVSQRALWTVFDRLYPSYLLGWAMEVSLRQDTCATGLTSRCRRRIFSTWHSAPPFCSM